MRVAGEVVVAIVVATARCTWVATSTEFKPELTTYPSLKSEAFLKNSSKQVDDDWCINYYSKSVYPDLVVD